MMTAISSSANNTNGLTDDDPSSEEAFSSTSNKKTRGTSASSRILNNLNRHTTTTNSHMRTLSNPLPLDLLISSNKEYTDTSKKSNNNHRRTQLTEALNILPTNNNNNLSPESSPYSNGGLSTSEVTKVLEKFTSLLEQIEVDQDKGQEEEEESKFRIGTSSSSKIKNSVEAFADLLLRGEGGSGDDDDDEDLLIVVETEADQTSLRVEDDDDDGNINEEDEATPPEEEEEDDTLSELGYESDQPMVSRRARASMKKMKLIKVNSKLKPVPETEVNNNSGSNSSNVIMISDENSPCNSRVMSESLSTESGDQLVEVVSPPPPPPSNSTVVLVMESSPIITSPGTSSNLSSNSTSSSITTSNAINTTSTTTIVNINQNEVNASPSGDQRGSGSSPNHHHQVPSSSGSGSATSSSTNNSAPGTPPPTNGCPGLDPPPPSGGSNNTTNTNTTTTTPNASESQPQQGARRAQVTSQTRRLGSANRWPHRLSSVLALLGCTLGLGNICRFGLLSVNYGANFVLQWCLLTVLLGIPLLTFHMSIGQYLSQGIIGMWKISPIFQGIGVGLLFSQAIVGLYSNVGISWMLIYFRDSFIARGEQYRWGRCVREFRECDSFSTSTSPPTSLLQSPYSNQNLSSIITTTTTTPNNGNVHMMSDLMDTVPDYFSAVVLQRTSPDYPSSLYVPNSLKFTVAFNLAVVWMLIYVSLSKGMKSYGKVIHGFILAPIVAMFILTFKMVGVMDNGLFKQTQWVDFFFNSQSWLVAAREVFFTWGLLGACIMQVTSHNRHAHPLRSDTMVVVLITSVVLILSSFVANSCFSIITNTVPHTATTLFQRYSYVPSSFESDRTYKFLKISKADYHQLPPNNVPASNMMHNPLLMGERITKFDRTHLDPTVSGYQILRMATELFPTAMGIMSSDGMSPFWTVLFYFMLVLFGLAQQLAIWHTVIRGLIAFHHKILRSWETTVTLFVCAMGFALSLPLCTETGIFVTYFLDFAVGSAWWIMILYLLELVAVFIVRGAPYCGENIVTVLITGTGRVAKFMAPFISFVWNVIMPVALLVLSIASFKSGNIRELYDWNPHRGYIFWPSWTREVGSLLQLLPLMAVPLAAIVQSCRYLGNAGGSDLVERFQQLYRPPDSRLGSASSTTEGGTTRRRRSSSRRSEDPPPKYTPPPSYSTATGAKIARFLRNSIRRSMRRINGNGGGGVSSSSPSSPSFADQPPPPAYASVILEINPQIHSAPPEYSEAMTTPRKEPVEVSVEVPGPSSSSSLVSGRSEDLLLARNYSPGTFDFLSFNRSRQRNSQDSQLALISDGLLYDNSNNSTSHNSHHDLEILGSNNNSDAAMRLAEEGGHPPPPPTHHHSNA